MPGSHLVDETAFLRDTGQRFRAARVDRGMSRIELAAAAGVHPNSVGVLERGDRDLNCLTVTRICCALGCMHLLLDRDGAGVDFSVDDRCYPIEIIRSIPDPVVIRCMGAGVRARRKELGLSLADLAEEAGVHLNTLWSYERGLVGPSGLTVSKVHLALGVSCVTASPERVILD